uniref:Uncharacterized protein n=1 Tax=Solanum lycopersicum TaxID=4081 RepID=K4DDM0_SOLLC
MKTADIHPARMLFAMLKLTDCGKGIEYVAGGNTPERSCNSDFIVRSFPIKFKLANPFITASC